MSQKIDPREVLIYLNELGYTNITAQQLKDFIIDLKKLLKYDSRFGGYLASRNNGQFYFPKLNECDSGEDITSEQDSGKVNQGQDRKFVKEIQKEKTQEGFSIKKDVQKEKHIAVHIFDSKRQKKVLHDHCVHVNNLDAVDTNTDASELKLPRDMINTASSGVSKPETTESTIRSIKPSSNRGTSSRASSKERKSKVTFIRPAIARPTINKSDPVALYHYYQSEWKRSKIPGQDNRDDLRWAIRERMLSGPRVEVKSKCSVQKCGWR